MNARIFLSLVLFLTGCVATQEEAPSKAAEAYVAQLGKKAPAGTTLAAAIALVEADGFKCR